MQRFRTLKAYFIERVILRYYNSQKSCYLKTDILRFRINAILSQFCEMNVSNGRII